MHAVADHGGEQEGHQAEEAEQASQSEKEKERDREAQGKGERELLLMAESRHPWVSIARVRKTPSGPRSSTPAFHSCASTGCMGRLAYFGPT